MIFFLTHLVKHDKRNNMKTKLKPTYRECAVASCKEKYIPGRPFQKFHNAHCRQIAFWEAKIARIKVEGKKHAKPRAKNRTARA